jgi:hypothetical protein
MMRDWLPLRRNKDGTLMPLHKPLSVDSLVPSKRDNDDKHVNGSDGSKRPALGLKRDVSDNRHGRRLARSALSNGLTHRRSDPALEVMLVKERHSNSNEAFPFGT